MPGFWKRITGLRSCKNIWLQILLFFQKLCGKIASSIGDFDWIKDRKTGLSAVKTPMTSKGNHISYAPTSVYPAIKSIKVFALKRRNLILRETLSHVCLDLFPWCKWLKFRKLHFSGLKFIVWGFKIHENHTSLIYKKFGDHKPPGF